MQPVATMTQEIKVKKTRRRNVHGFSAELKEAMQPVATKKTVNPTEANDVTPYWMIDRLIEETRKETEKLLQAEGWTRGASQGSETFWSIQSESGHIISLSSDRALKEMRRQKEMHNWQSFVVVGSARKKQIWE
jgi:predicted RNA binding protein YcfA (HicA-like mRNA interferase family)